MAAFMASALVMSSGRKYSPCSQSSPTFWMPGT